MVSCTFVLNENGNRIVSYLNCNGDRPYVNWYNLDNYWNDNEPAGLSATLFISLLTLGRSFSLKVVRSNLQAFDQSRLFLTRGRHIFCCPEIWSPRGSREVF